MRGGKRAWAVLVVAVTTLLAFTSGAAAFKEVTKPEIPGSGGAHTQGSAGLAVNFKTGRLYVSDTQNNRIDIFGPSGSFEKAFGWGVSDGIEKFEFCTNNCKIGNEGTGKGQFNEPRSIAVDQASGDVYVVDYENHRIERFDAEGNFILTFGGKVNKTKVEEGAPKEKQNVCPVDLGDVCGAGVNEFAEGAFSSNGPLLEGIFVGVGPTGVVDVIDSTKSGGEKYRLQMFEPSGIEIAPQQILLEGGTAQSLAVNSTGEFYISTFAAGEDVIHKYQAGGGVPIETIGKPFEGDAGTLGLAVDVNDNLFAVSSGGSADRVSIMKRDSTSKPLRRFGYGSFLKFVYAIVPYASASGDIYAAEIEGSESEGNRVLQLDFPEAGPLIFPQACEASKPVGNAKAILNAEINPEGKATTYHFEYITKKHFEENGDKFTGTFPASSTPESASIGSNFTLHKTSASEASAQAEVVPETQYLCRVVASNADKPAGVTGLEGEFETPPALEILGTWTAGVETETATLSAEVNPLGIAATGFFQYVDDAGFQEDVEKAEGDPEALEKAEEECAEEKTPVLKEECEAARILEHGFDNAQKAPPKVEEEIEFGAGETPVERSVPLVGLAPGTSYHYRLVATDEKLEPEGRVIASEAETFRTYPIGSGGLLDSRAYELVSPGRKNSAEVAIGTTAGGLWSEEHNSRIQAAAGAGDAITYTSWTSFGDPEGAPPASQYFSRRVEGQGWETKNISPFGFINFPTEVSYRGFTPDLRLGALATSEPALTEEAQEGHTNIYLRDSETGALQALTIEEPELEGNGGICTGYAGTSADGKHAVFAQNGAMAGAPVGKGFSLYEWHNDPADGSQRLVVKATGGEYTLTATSARAKGTLSSGSAEVSAIEASATAGSFHVGDEISGIGIPAGTTILAVGEGTLNLSANATAGGVQKLRATETTPALGAGALATDIQTALEALPAIGTGNVTVSGGPGGATGSSPYSIAFGGALAGVAVVGLKANDVSLSGGNPSSSVDAVMLDAGGNLRLVSVLPNGIPAAPAGSPGFGASPPGADPCAMDQQIIRHVISEDGSVVIWTYNGKYINSEQPLLARINGQETIQLDAPVSSGIPKPGDKAGGKGVFRGASADGSKVLFTAPGKLISGAATGSLYRYDTKARTLSNLTPGGPPDIQGMLGISEDATYAYFVAGGVLTGSEENSAHQKAEEGKYNLYLYHEGEGVRFIATLSVFDELDWDFSPERLSARVSPDGRHLAFLTVESKALSGFENTIAGPAPPHCQPSLENGLKEDPHCPEAYLYDADTDTLTCASCNPAGSRPMGPTQLPGWSNPYQGPRYLSDDGNRLYFESRDVMSLADQNKRRDIYEFERAGSGDCEAKSPDFVPASGGCLALLSSGKNEDESYLLDASDLGRDVFFATRGVLVGWDENENYDVYDAREGGGFAEPPEPQPSCIGEGCKPTPRPPPTAPAPATNSFIGPGNPKPKKPKKHGKKHHKQKRGHQHKRGQRR